MNKVFVLYAAVLGVALLGAGCATPQGSGGNAAATAEKQEQGDENARKLLDAFLNNDAKSFVGVLSEEMQTQFGIKDFENSRKVLTETLGQPIAYSFNTMLEHPLFKVSVWKVRFERRGSEGEKIYQEILFRVVSGFLDGRKLIISFNFL
ncbi:MAG: hypothetical protein LBM70_05120 [Victivallales bacterium]|jgi:hypothetical protein|nr:hypothetical protein [Victivallales bacterium]